MLTTNKRFHLIRRTPRVDGSTDVGASSSSKPSVFINRNYALLLGGQTVSLLGDAVFGTTLVLWIASVIARGHAWAPLAVSGVGLAASLPVFLVGPIAGVFVDRWDRRRTMLRMDVLRAVLVMLLVPATGLVALPFVSGGHVPIPWQLGLIYGVVFLATACSQFFNPARLALIGDVVAEPDRMRAVGLSQVISCLALIAGPPLAAPLLFVFGAQWAILLDACTFIVSFVTILLVTAPRQMVNPSAEQRGNVWQEFGAGVRFFVRNSVLTTILVSISLVILGAGALTTLNIFFVTGNLHVSPNLYGFTGMAMAAGSIAGAVVAAMVAPRLGVVRSYWLALIVMGAMVVIYAQMTSFVPALVLLFLLGIPQAVPEVALGPLVLRVTPRELIGRVSAVIQPTLSLARMISAVAAGYLVSTVLRGFHGTLLGLTFGPINTLFVGTGLLVIAGGLYAMVKLHRALPATQATPAPADVASVPPPAEVAPLSTGVEAETSPCSA